MTQSFIDEFVCFFFFSFLLLAWIQKLKAAICLSSAQI